MKTLFEGKKLYAAIIAFLFIIIFFITFHIIRNHYKDVFKNTITENTLTANLLSSLIYEHQKAAISILESYAQRPFFIDEVKKKVFNHVIPHLKSLSEHHTEIDTPFITDKSGTVWANYPVSKESYGKNLAYRDWYKGASKKWRPYISTVFRLIVLEKDLAVAVSVPVLDRKGKVIGILGSTQRISFLATFIKENTIDPRKSITLIDQEGNIIFSNAVPYQEKITKYPDAHVLEKTLAGVIIDMEIADEKEKGSTSYVSIAPVRGIGWSVIVGEEKNTILKSLYGHFIRSAATGFVIFLFLTVSLVYFRKEYKYRKTKELLQARVALRESEKLYRPLFENMLNGSAYCQMHFDDNDRPSDFTYLSVNSAFETLTGLRNVVGKKVSEVILGIREADPELLEICGRVSKTGKPERFEMFVDSLQMWLWISVYSPERGYFVAVFDVITERKRAELTLQESEERLRTIVEASLDAIIAVSTGGRLVLFNTAAQELFQYSEEEALNQPATILLREEIGKIHQERLERFLKVGVGQCGHIGKREEKFFRRKDGSLFEAEVSMSGGRLDGLRLVVLAIHDITSRKQAEETLRRAEENFRRSLDESPLGVRIVTIEGETIYANRAMLNIYRYDSIEELRTTPLKERYTSQSYIEFKIRMEKRKRGGDVSEYDIIIVRKDGELRHLHIFRKEILWDGERQFQVLYNDITERKRVEEALRESERKLREAQEMAQLGYWRWEVGTGKVEWSEEVYGIFRLDPNKFTPHIDSIQALSPWPDEHERDKELIHRAMENHAAGTYEQRFLRPDGSIGYYCSTFQGNYDDGGNLITIVGTVQDITERKQAEEALSQSEEKHRVLIETTDTGYLILDAQGRVIDANKEYIRLTGYGAPEEILGRGVVEWTAPYDLERNAAEVKRCVEQGYIRNLEIDYINRSGQITPIELNATVLGSGDSARILSLCRDITERKLAEEVLRKSEENFRRSLDDSPLGVRIVTMEGETIYANRAILDIYGYDSIEELKTTPLKERYTPGSYAAFQTRKEKRLLREYDPFEYEVSIVRKNGEVRDLQVFRKEILWNGERQFQTIYQDITERKLVEAQLHAALQEKELLIREVHHRVKNNMQVMSGLLDLQASSTGNPELTEMLNESKSRIRAMALIHEKLYDSKDFTRIDLAGYVRALSQELFQVYAINPGKIDLIIQINGAIYVNISKAIPCGLILNELISNALEHAFPGDKLGKLQITIHETKNAEIEIVICDNGLGLPDDVDIHRLRSVGLYLVNELVTKQLDGQIEVRRDGGTEFRIKFPLLFVENSEVT
jgi:PAS domain S-box-containing protein